MQNRESVLESYLDASGSKGRTVRTGNMDKDGFRLQGSGRFLFQWVRQRPVQGLTVYPGAVIRLGLSFLILASSLVTVANSNYQPCERRTSNFIQIYLSCSAR